jgi:hypothetical protein
MAPGRLWDLGLRSNDAFGHSGSDAHSLRIPNDPLKFFSEYFRDASAISLTEHIHGEYVHNRRTRVLSDHLAKIIPQDFHINTGLDRDSLEPSIC